MIKRRAAIDRAEKAEAAQESAAKRAAEAKAAREVQALQVTIMHEMTREGEACKASSRTAKHVLVFHSHILLCFLVPPSLQNQVAQQHAASLAAQQALARQERENAARQRVIATQHEHYEKLEAELKAHEAEWKRTRGAPIKLLPAVKPPKRRASIRRSRIARPRTIRRYMTPRRPSSNPFIRVTPNRTWTPRRRILTPTLRRWIIIRTIQARRVVLSQPQARTSPVPRPVARRQYRAARTNARNTLRRIITAKRTWKRREALQAFRQLSEQLSVTAAMARVAAIRANAAIHRKLNRILSRQGRRIALRRSRFGLRRPTRPYVPVRRIPQWWRRATAAVKKPATPRVRWTPKKFFKTRRANKDKQVRDALTTSLLGMARGTATRHDTTTWPEHALCCLAC